MRAQSNVARAFVSAPLILVAGGMYFMAIGMFLYVVYLMFALVMGADLGMYATAIFGIVVLVAWVLRPHKPAPTPPPKPPRTPITMGPRITEADFYQPIQRGGPRRKAPR